MRERPMDREARRAPARRGRRRGDRSSAAARRCLRASLGRLFSSAGLLGLVVGYCLLGALLFQFLEAEFEMEQRKSVERYRDDCIKELWHITERLNVLYEKNWTLLVSERLRRFETSVVAATMAEGYDGSESMDVRRQWSYGGALFYSVAVITTVGFGKLAPKTPAGKMVTMLYAVMGIPLMLLCLAYLGTLLAHALQLGYTTFCCSVLSSKIICPPKEEMDGKSHSALIPATLQGGDLQEDFEETIEDNSIEEYSMKDSKDLHEVKAKSEMLMLPVVEGAASDIGLSFARSIAPNVKNHPLECKKHAAAHDVSALVKIDIDKEMRDSEALHLAENLHQLKEAQAIGNSGKSRIANQCFVCGEEGNNSQEDAHTSREWTSEHPDTPSRVPLIGKKSACPQNALAETKHIWTSTLTMRPPTPIPNKDVSKRREKWSKCTPDSIPLAQSDCPKTSEHHVPVWLVLGVLCAYICIGGVTFATWEDWTFLDGAYFCFITLSTIGFGETVPGKSPQVENFIQSSTSDVSESHTSHSSLRAPFPDTKGEEEQQLRLVACCVYLFLGLVLIASSISLVQEKVITFHHALWMYLGINEDESSVEEENEEMDESHEPLKEMSFN